MKKGQWIRIVSMEGEPQMHGRIGQYEMTDSIGQIHGTWGVAIQPDKDSYELLTDEEATKIKEAEAKAAAEYEPPIVKGAKLVKVPFVGTRYLSRLERLNGAKEAQVLCKVVLDLNGNAERYKQLLAEYGGHLRGGKWCIVGVPDNVVASVYDRIKRNIGQDCCPVCSVEPCDLRKNPEDYLPAIDQACELALKPNE